MIRVENEEEVKGSMKALIQGLERAKAMSGQDIVKEVEKMHHQEGQPLSPETAAGQPREALYEAVYQSQIKPSGSNLKNALDAEAEMTDREKDKEIDGIVDRFIRDFVDDLLKGV